MPRVIAWSVRPALLAVMLSLYVTWTNASACVTQYGWSLEQDVPVRDLQCGVDLQMRFKGIQPILLQAMCVDL